VAEQTRRFAAAGARIDPILTHPTTRRARVADWLRYARHRRWLARAGACHRILPPTPGRNEALRSAHNELRSLARAWPALDPVEER